MTSTLAMPPTSAIPHSKASDASPETRKVLKAARDFEAVLLNSLFASLEKTFATMPGTLDEQDPAADNYRGMGVEALANQMAGPRGFGIARMIAHELLKTPA